MQWLNPKAWMACLSGITAFELATSVAKTAVFSAVYFLVCLAALSAWAWIGQLAQHQLNLRAIIVINRLLALALIGLGLSMLLPVFSF